MPNITGTFVGGSNVVLRLFVIVMLGICGVGVFVYTTGLASYSQAAVVDFSPVKHVPTHSGTQAMPLPVFNILKSPLTTAYITGTTQYSPNAVEETGLYVCAIAANASSLNCAHPDEYHPLADGSLNFSIGVPAGTYYVYSAVQGTEYEAYYDTGDIDSAGYSLIPVVVKARQVVKGITPVDWSQP